MFALCELEQGYGPGGRWEAGQEAFDVADGLRGEEDIGAEGADFGGDVVDDDDAAGSANGVDDGLGLILARAALNGTFHHGWLRCVGESHFGGFGK